MHVYTYSYLFPQHQNLLDLLLRQPWRARTRRLLRVGGRDVDGRDEPRAAAARLPASLLGVELDAVTL